MNHEMFMVDAEKSVFVGGHVPVDALWCTGFQRLLIYLAFLLMLFDVLVSKGC
jgi:hypothetical protein